jgi:hypothetical protein
MSFWGKIRGTAEAAFQIGLGGPQWKRNVVAIEARNAADSAFAVVRVANASASNDALNTLSITDTSFLPRAGMSANVLLPVSAQLNAVYLGFFPVPVAITKVLFRVTAAGAGAQTAEVGLLTTPLGPNGANQTITKVSAASIVSSLITTGAKTETVAWSLSGHCYLGVRTAMATAQPTFQGTSDYGVGDILTVAGAAALTTFTTGTGVVTLPSSTGVGISAIA